jgi:hypothetical protein
MGAAESMSATSEIPSLTVRGHADSVAVELSQALRDVGLEVTTNFELDGACAPLSEPCPHHGMKPCSCQLILLAVQGFPLASPSLIRIHSDAEQASVQLDPGLDAEERQFLHILTRVALAL